MVNLVYAGIDTAHDTLRPAAVRHREQRSDAHHGKAGAEGETLSADKVIDNLVHATASERTRSSIQSLTATADWRRYFGLHRNLTFATRGLHFGRYGGNSDTAEYEQEWKQATVRNVHAVADQAEDEGAKP